MDIKWLKTFIVAAKHENFRIASEELFLTQPAVTKHIKRLEETLHTELFDRIGKSISLTSAGHHFLPLAMEMMDKYEQGLESFESWKQGYVKKLTIAAAPQIASSILPSILRSFMDQYPDIEVLVRVVSSYEMGEEISLLKADIGLSRLKPIQASLHVETLHEDKVMLIAPPQKQMEEGEVLKKYRLITHNHPEYWEDLLHVIKRNYPAVRTMMVNQMEITKRFIGIGLGVSYLPYTTVMEEIKEARLMEVKADKISPPASTTYLLSKVTTKEANLFISFLKRQIATM
ncbi:LysR family transcriptional regulator [Bacillus sp. Au-Bac7]|uniref:LysR family transcriptional regulator n=1 Tax=Bacillus sp. Au-Bac7 TaxID=2906458 RepID=UPI001E4953E0|nr:LysR family transcriptional regulator [Bacillus sp. Au-Bac7]MCE4048224.1 LysR family transcriptional regulator [Bacillus sp. Au-Bac7]